MAGKSTGWGARIYYYDDGVIQVMQTRMDKAKNRYVGVQDEKGNVLVRYIDPGSDEELVEAILAAGRGEL